MSLEEAKAFIEKMKSDEAFSECVLAAGDVEKRLSKCKEEGFDCTVEDIKALQAICNKPQIPRGSLPLNWECKGPCHTKCAPIV